MFGELAGLILNYMVISGSCNSPADGIEED
jgi:hypothetical protein